MSLFIFYYANISRKIERLHLTRNMYWGFAMRLEMKIKNERTMQNNFNEIKIGIKPVGRDGLIES